MRGRRVYPCAQARPYWTLLEREGPEARWTIAFGSYTRAEVEGERKDRRDHGVRAMDLKIIRTGSRRQDIEAKVEELNACLVG